MTQDRYLAPDYENFEPGSNGTVLANKLKIKKITDMEDLESKAYQRILERSVNHFQQTHAFTAKDLTWLHEQWLGEIYYFAGQYRTVNMSKNGFLFAAAHLIPRLMKDFEKNVLKKYTPAIFENTAQLINALAIVHVEFILIHPFREGNGRLARLLSLLMALQAGGILDYSVLAEANKREKYFQAVQNGQGHDYHLMEELFKEMLSLD
ncbi:MAG: Fic/DOC family protein [Gammaproteobacteria bacterium]